MVAMRIISSLLLFTVLSSTALLFYAPVANAQSTSVTDSPTSLNSIFCVGPSDCWIVGDNGLILRGSGSPISWSVVASPTTSNLLSISCASSTDCWIVGDDGVILHGSGSPIIWGTAASPTASNLNSVSCASPSNCWAVGSNGTIVYVSQSTVNPPPPKTENITVISTSSASNPITVDSQVMVTVKLVDSNGNGLSGGVVQYFNGSWSSFGTTSVDGSVSKKLLLGNYDFRMTYTDGQVEKWQNVAESTVTFQTVNVQVQLKNSFGVGVSGGVVEYYSGGGWHAIGVTDSRGLVAVELLAATYDFSMNYNHAHSEKWQNIDWSSNVIFQTSMFTP